MKKLPSVLLAGILMTACSHKNPDLPVAPAPTVSNPNPPTPPPITNCQGGTIPYSIPTGQTVNDNSSKSFTIPGFNVGCGDFINLVAIRKDSTQSWFMLGTVNNGASYYSLLNNVVTVFNMTGIVMQVDIEATLK